MRAALLQQFDANATALALAKFVCAAARKLAQAPFMASGLAEVARSRGSADDVLVTEVHGGTQVAARAATPRLPPS